MRQIMKFVQIGICLAAANLLPTLVAQSTIRVPTWTSKPETTGKKQDLVVKQDVTKPAATTPTCWWLPLQKSCLPLDHDKKVDAVNTFWNTADTLSYFNQIKTVYNAASNGTTVAADLASLNFLFGPQLVLGTNVQAAPAASDSTSTPGKPPSLSSASVGQAAQNVLHGGTVYVGLLYPLIAVGQKNTADLGNVAVAVNAVARQGIDVQNFKSGTDINVSSPPTHTNAQLEGYLLVNAINHPSGKTTGVAGSVFLGGSYGAGYTSHQYARDYGFGPTLNHGIGEVSVGIILNSVATFKFSRAFGPSQTYMDSTTNVLTRVNSFKTWSFGLTYQKSAN